MTQRTRKPSTENLPGKREQRVFIGGQYDFMPTLRVIAQFVSDISSPENTFYPVIPIDYDIRVEETMDRDLEILNRCGCAIFDLCDLGAQLVEMQEAKQKDIKTLLVYPVRERINEPARGRRTVLSFHLPHFGYSTFDELEGIVWRFLMDALSEKDHFPRVIHDPILAREIKRARTFLGHGNANKAKKVIESLLKSPRYQGVVDVWLQLAVVSCRSSDLQACESALQQATVLSQGDVDVAEILYYKAIIERLRPTPDWGKVRGHLLEAHKLLAQDGRIAQFLGFTLWKGSDRAGAIEYTRRALEDRGIPDPLVAIHALNNLGYFLGEEVLSGNEKERNLEEALELTKYLKDYGKAFRRRDSSWLDTRGWVLTLKARTQASNGYQKEAARETAQEAIDILSEAANVEATDVVRRHLEEARALYHSLE